MIDETDTSAEAVERPCRNCGHTLNGHRDLQNFGTYQTHDPAYCMRYLRDDRDALLARAEAAEAELHKERARVLALKSEVAALNEMHQSDIATGAELEAKLAAAREWADDLLDAAEQAYKDGGAEMHRLIRTPPDFYDADAPARADLADAAYLEGVKAGLEAAARTARGDGESEFFNPVQAIRALDPAAVARAARKGGE